jgi:hypothetical protein
MTAFWHITPCSLVEVDRHFHYQGDIIALMTEAVRTSETSVSFHETTQGNIPEDSSSNSPP